ncbi:TetR/AcrR family transcriptional regulator [Klenkia taihuensis]|uniref:Transcriptional regulator, TetR family n=1 Tax=Klenkia taihuensis TaxID=1225127 RepID=A0A1I1QAD5_9ACTN|nr:TetR/AcrR family transcriptional regulator [Klenkia taihuensis]SFD15080.1 transcriptional regulator, TetR family [Klenkia taihuensis]
MGRWEPDARGRLQQAAMELFVEHGYERTTTADIAARAGLSERTYFRHFPDKREVLFDSTHALDTLVVEGIAAAPADAAPLDALAAGLRAGAAMLHGLGDHARARTAVIASQGELRERELAKMSGLVAASAAALVERGVGEAAALLSAEAGVAAFRVAFDRWVATPAGPPLPDVVDAVLAELRQVVAPA